MTGKAIQELRKIDLGGSEFCPFSLVPGANGRWLLWWAEENCSSAACPGRRDL